VTPFGAVPEGAVRTCHSLIRVLFFLGASFGLDVLNVVQAGLPPDRQSWTTGMTLLLDHDECSGLGPAISPPMASGPAADKVHLPFPSCWRRPPI
jgi:hypothetical protein